MASATFKADLDKLRQILDDAGPIVEQLADFIPVAGPVVTEALKVLIAAVDAADNAVDAAAASVGPVPPAQP